MTDAPAAPGAAPHDLRREVVEAEPLNAATPMPLLDGRHVPAEQFYVRSHFPQPQDLHRGYRLTVSGLVDSPVQLDLGRLRSLPARTLAVTLECAGNGRTALSPSAPGTPWGFGAAGTAAFTGCALRDVLDLAGYRPEAAHLLAIGGDAGEVEGHVLPYARSLPMPRALHPDTLLAWAMDGEPLTAEHGAPLRMVVPGWYAMASVKWVVELQARASEFHGWFHEERYCYLDDADAEQGAPVAGIRIRAVVATPTDGTVLPVGEAVTVTGSAWAGAEGVASVDVSADGGQTFSPAELMPADGPYAARGWRWTWTPRAAGAHELVVRATDGHGRTQPMTQRWNRLGYGNNVVHRVTVHAAEA